jgi:hypothetical protein
MDDRANKMSHFINANAVPSHPVKEPSASNYRNNKQDSDTERSGGLKEFSTNVSPESVKRSANSSMSEVHDIQGSASEDTQGSNSENASASSKSRARNLRRKRAIQRRKQAEANSNGKTGDSQHDETETKKVDPPSLAVVATKPEPQINDEPTVPTSTNKTGENGHKRNNETKKTDLEQKPDSPDVLSHSTVKVETNVVPIQVLPLSTKEEEQVPEILSNPIVKEEPSANVVTQPMVEVIDPPKVHLTVAPEDVEMTEPSKVDLTTVELTTTPKVETIEPTKVEMAEPEKVEMIEPTEVEMAEPAKVELTTTPNVELAEPPRVELNESLKVELNKPVAISSTEPTGLTCPYDDDNKVAAELGKEDCGCNSCVIS